MRERPSTETPFPRPVDLSAGRRPTPPGCPAAQVNPLEFKINRIHDYATSADIKAALVRSGRPLALGVTETNSAFYFPCTAAYSCPGNGKPIVNCPNDPVYKDYSSCFTDGKSMVSMKGEWFVKANGAPMGQAGGHAINIVGYNDFHRDEWGNTGGFILRNTWKDGKAGHGLMAVGSHSWKFFAHMVDEDDEKYSCPNPANPRSWTECADLEACKHDIDGDVLEGPPKTYRELMCINTGQIKYLKSPCDDKTSYWLKNRTDWGSEGLFVSCFVTEAGGKAGDVCLPPLTLDDLATIFFPVDNTKDGKEIENDMMQCGFNFISCASLACLDPFPHTNPHTSCCAPQIHNPRHSQHPSGRGDGDALRHRVDQNLVPLQG